MAAFRYRGPSPYVFEMSNEPESPPGGYGHGLLRAPAQSRSGVEDMSMLPSGHIGLASYDPRRFHAASTPPRLDCAEGVDKVEGKPSQGDT